jgi:nitroreductase
MEILRVAVRCPDHGKLEPWRFVVMDRAAMERVAAAAEARALAMGQDAEGAAKTARSFREGGAIIAVIAAPKPSAKIPVWEQEMSAGALCLGLLNAAMAAGWGANWLSGPLARDGEFLRETLGAAEGEFVAGFIHLGRETVVPADRPRPDPEALVTWL